MRISLLPYQSKWATAAAQQHLLEYLVSVLTIKSSNPTTSLGNPTLRSSLINHVICHKRNSETSTKKGTNPSTGSYLEVMFCRKDYSKGKGKRTFHQGSQG